jgi:hypothetical protein
LAFECSDTPESIRVRSKSANQSRKPEPIGIRQRENTQGDVSAAELIVSFGLSVEDSQTRTRGELLQALGGINSDRTNTLKQMI